MGPQSPGRTIHPLVAISIVVGLSLGVAAVLFGVLESTGGFESKYGNFGGAAAGFFAAFLFLHRWYDRLAKGYTAADALSDENEKLRRALTESRLPPFEVPPGFKPFVDHEHSLLFSYPEEWRRQPLMLQIQGIFAEDPLKLRPGDRVPGKFSVAISSPGQQTYSLKEVVFALQPMGVSLDEIEQELGVKYSETTEALQVPIERLFSLMGAKGKDRRAQIYEINKSFIDAVLPGETVREDTELVGGIESMLIEKEIQQEGDEPILLIFVVTYVSERDLIVTFSFSDNKSDRPKIELVRKQVLSSAKFWEPTMVGVAA